VVPRLIFRYEGDTKGAGLFCCNSSADEAKYRSGWSVGSGGSGEIARKEAAMRGPAAVAAAVFLCFLATVRAGAEEIYLPQTDEDVLQESSGAHILRLMPYELAVESPYSELAVWSASKRP